MKSPIAILQFVLADAGTRCGTSTTRDLKTIMSRVEHEGLSFLTITLASFGSEIQKSLDQGFVGHDQFLGFSRTGSLPRLLGGFFDRVFDRGTGRLLDEPSVDAIRALRQITLMWAKIKIDCTDARNKAAVRGFFECEQEVRRNDASRSGVRNDQFSRVAALLWQGLFSDLDNQIFRDGVVPKHGSGATADRLRGNSKYKIRHWPARLESVFPYWENALPSESFISQERDVTYLEPGDELPVKVVLVPKTLKTPRIIAEEPTCMQFMQQGILELMMSKFKEHDNSRNFVLFESQIPNQEMARRGSIDGSLATLDLSEASDRVSNQLVRLLFARHRPLREAVDATRSRKADVQGKTIRLAKFASMGSALTFPVESLVFMTVVFCGIEDALNRQLTKRDIKSMFGRVRTYGDDIIVPVEYVLSVNAALGDFGFRVNSNKSFWTGKFRESCGKDYYNGVDVSIVRIRSMLPTSRRNAEELVSTVETRNHFFEAGYVKTVDALDNMIERIIPFPIVGPESALLGRLAYSPSIAEKHDKDLQRPLVKGVVVFSVLPDSHLDGSGALLKWFLKRGILPFEDELHLQRAGRPVSVRIKDRWAPAY